MAGWQHTASASNHQQGDAERRIRCAISSTEMFTIARMATTEGKLFQFFLFLHQRIAASIRVMFRLDKDQDYTQFLRRQQATS
jgi:hypothetical protein